MPRTNIEFSKKQLQALRDIARENDFLIDRGRLVGEGNIRQMLLALASGEYRLISVFQIDNFDPDTHKYKIVPVCEVEGCRNQVAIKTTSFRLDNMEVNGDMIIGNVCWVHMDKIGKDGDA